MNPFSIEIQDIKNLTPDKLVELLRRLIFKRASELGISLEMIRVPTDIFTPDGGLDARIDFNVPPNTDWLAEGISGWQFKAQQLDQKKAVRTVYPKKGAKKISPEVCDLIEDGGTYVLVCGKTDTPNSEKWVKAIEADFAKKGYPNGKAKVLTAGDIAAWAQNYPALVIEFKSEFSNCISLAQWGEQNDITSFPFRADEARQAFIQELRSKIQRIDKQPLIARITGHSGIGKSRLIYEALNHDSCRDYVVYISSADQTDRAIVTRLGEDPWPVGILVVDDCNTDMHRELAKAVSAYQGKLVLITCTSEHEKPVSESTFNHCLNGLAENASKELLDVISPELPDIACSSILKFAEGYPIIIGMLAANFATDPRIYDPDYLHQLGVSQIMNKLIQGRRAAGSTAVIDAIMVLSIVALFEKLGWEDEVSSQGKAVFEALDMPWHNAKFTVETEAERGLIQKKGRYRAVSPRPLEFHLATRWWAENSCSDAKQLINNLPDSSSVLEFFKRMKMFAHIEKVKECTANMLFDNSFLQRNLNLHTRIGSQVFYELSHIDQKTAITFLKRQLGGKSKDELEKFEEGRRNVIFALEKLARWPHCFIDAANLLLKLAEAENETYGNNATGVWLGFFNCYLSGTPASFDERFTLVSEVLKSGSELTRSLCIDALDNMLRTSGYSRSGSSDNQGVHMPPPEWKPRIYGDIWGPMRKALSLLLDFACNPGHEFEQKAQKAISESVEGLIHHRLAEEAIDAVERIWQATLKPTGHFIDSVSRILENEIGALSKEQTQRLEKLMEAMVGDSFKSKLLRFVGVSPWIGQRGRSDYEQHQAFLDQQLKDLARQALNDSLIFLRELPWLVSGETENAMWFGITLGEMDNTNTFLEPIWTETISSTDNAATFISGYIRGMKNRNDERCEAFLLSIYNDPYGKKHFLELAHNYKPSQSMLEAILQGTKENWIEPWQLKILGYSGWSNDLSPEVLVDFLNQILSINPDTALYLIELLLMYIHPKNKLSDELVDVAEQLLTNPNIPAAIIKDRSNHGYFWKELALMLLKKDISHAPKLVEFIFKYIDEFGKMYLIKYLREVIKECIMLNAGAVWPVLGDALLADDVIPYHIEHLMKAFEFRSERDGFSILDHVPNDMLWEWVDNNPENGPEIIASCIHVNNGSFFSPLALKLLEKYGDIEKVRNRLSNTFVSGSWWGSESEHYEKKLGWLKKWLAEINSTKVQSWLQHEIDSHVKRIAYAKRREAEGNW